MFHQMHRGLIAAILFGIAVTGNSKTPNSTASQARCDLRATPELSAVCAAISPDRRGNFSVPYSSRWNCCVGGRTAKHQSRDVRPGSNQSSSTVAISARRLERRQRTYKFLYEWQGQSDSPSHVWCCDPRLNRSQHHPILSVI